MFNIDFRPIGVLICILAILAVFGIWKLIEACIWLVQHIAITIR